MYRYKCFDGETFYFGIIFAKDKEEAEQKLLKRYLYAHEWKYEINLVVKDAEDVYQTGLMGVIDF